MKQDLGYSKPCLSNQEKKPINNSTSPGTVAVCKQNRSTQRNQKVDDKSKTTYKGSNLISGMAPKGVSDAQNVCEIIAQHRNPKKNPKNSNRFAQTASHRTMYGIENRQLQWSA